MKYILQHPIHEMNAWSDPAETNQERDTTHTHQDAESYSGVGHIGNVKADAEHRLSTGAEMKADAKSIAGQNGVAEKGKHKLSDIAETDAKATAINAQHGGASDDEQKLSDIAESAETKTKIVRFADFQK
jgi:hypothetical protein